MEAAIQTAESQVFTRTEAAEIKTFFGSCPDSFRCPPLSPRQAQVLVHLRRGAANKIIARELGIAPATVKTHVRFILRKFKVQRRWQVPAFAPMQQSSPTPPTSRTTMPDSSSAVVIAVPTVAGTPFAGGLYAGRFFIGAQAYALIVAEAKDGELDKTVWGSTKKEVVGALSCGNGLANTLAMEAAGCAPAKWARALRIGDHEDWYLPSRIEALIAFAELREQFKKDWYWTSTQVAGYPEYAWYQNFGYGYQYFNHKDNKLRARAVRRVPIQ